MNSSITISIKHHKDGNLLVNEAYEQLLLNNNIDSAVTLWNQESTPVKNIRKERGTERVYLATETGSIEAYIKRYLPASFKERLKNILSLKFELFDALHEWSAINNFHTHNLPTMTPIAAGRDGRKTCNLTLGIVDYTRASTLFENFQPHERTRKHNLIAKIANLAGKMHSSGMAHQDFYLVHFFVKENEDDAIFLIDLQRVISREKLRTRWIVKDLGQLLFSAEPFVSKTDILFFWKIYTDITGKNIYNNRKLIKKIFAKATSIKNRQQRKAKK